MITSTVREIEASAGHESQRHDHGLDDEHRKVRAEINLRTVFYEVTLENLAYTKESDFLRWDRLANWSQSYEQAARDRLETAAHAGGRSPDFKVLAYRRLYQIRLAAAMYNPSGLPFRVIFGLLPIESEMRMLSGNTGVWYRRFSPYEFRTQWSPES